MVGGPLGPGIFGELSPTNLHCAVQTFGTGGPPTGKVPTALAAVSHPCAISAGVVQQDSAGNAAINAGREGGTSQGGATALGS